MKYILEQKIKIREKYFVNQDDYAHSIELATLLNNQKNQDTHLIIDCFFDYLVIKDLVGFFAMPKVKLPPFKNYKLKAKNKITKTVYDLNVEMPSKFRREYFDVIGSELALEINREVINDLCQYAGTTVSNFLETQDINKILDNKPDWVVGSPNTIYQLANKMSYDIQDSGHLNVRYVGFGHQNMYIDPFFPENALLYGKFIPADPFGKNGYVLFLHSLLNPSNKHRNTMKYDKKLFNAKYYCLVENVF